ncbi:MAG: penicillin-insensitive murein endopeptidase [Nannocystaceae bacterium]
MPFARRLHAWLVAAALGLGGGAIVDDASAATSAAKKSTAKKSTAKKSTAKKSTAKKPTSTKAKPQLRSASGPEAIDEEGEGDELGEGEAEGPLNPEDEYARIEAEILEEQAKGRSIAPIPEPEPEPAPAPDDSPVWVDHEVIAGDTVESLAGRYNVQSKSIIRWNKLDAKKPRLRSGKTVRIHAVHPPPPRERREVEIKKGDSWSKIAAEHGVDEKLLKKWNPAKKGKDGKPKPQIVAGHTLVVWVDAAADAATSAQTQSRLLAAKVRGTGVSVGAPTRGRLVNGVELPDNPDLYTRRKPDQSYGSSHTIRTMVAAISEFRRISGYTRELVIGAISLQRGGRFRPHRSHQSGRDVDIRLPILRSIDHHNAPRASEVDWRATWRLIDAFVQSGEVQYIFLDYKMQRTLYKFARESGVPKQRLAEVIQWPRDSRSNNGIVRHAPGHTTHLHVRVKCGEHERHCQTAR